MQGRRGEEGWREREREREIYRHEFADVHIDARREEGRDGGSLDGVRLAPPHISETVGSA